MNEKIKSAVIFIGGDCFINELDSTRLSADLVIAADCGMNTARSLNIRPDVLMGDFDSSTIPDDMRDIETIVSPAKKNDTDTMLAVKYAIARGAKSITLIGGTGGRIDHALSNVFLIEYLAKMEISAVLEDGRNRLRVLTGGKTVLKKERFTYFGVIALEDSVVSISGCKYPLDKAHLTRTEPYAVSNEIIGDHATIEVIGEVIITES